MGQTKRNTKPIFHFTKDETGIQDLMFNDHQGNLSLDSDSPLVYGDDAQALIDARDDAQAFDSAWGDCSAAAQTWWGNRDSTAQTEIRLSLVKLASAF